MRNLTQIKHRGLAIQAFFFFFFKCEMKPSFQQKNSKDGKKIKIEFLKRGGAKANSI